MWAPLSAVVRRTLRRAAAEPLCLGPAEGAPRPPRPAPAPRRGLRCCTSSAAPPTGVRRRRAGRFKPPQRSPSAADLLREADAAGYGAGAEPPLDAAPAGGSEAPPAPRSAAVTRGRVPRPAAPAAEGAPPPPPPAPPPPPQSPPQTFPEPQDATERLQRKLRWSGAGIDPGVVGSHYRSHKVPKRVAAYHGGGAAGAFSQRARGVPAAFAAAAGEDEAPEGPAEGPAEVEDEDTGEPADEGAASAELVEASAALRREMAADARERPDELPPPPAVELDLPQEEHGDRVRCHVCVSKERLGRDRNPTVLFRDAHEPGSVLPTPFEKRRAVQLRDPSGTRVHGLGIWQPNTRGQGGTVRVCDWLPESAFTPLSPALGADPQAVGGMGLRYWYAKFHKALEYRQVAVDLTTTDGFRLLNGDADGCPGVTVDIYARAARVVVHERCAREYLHHLVQFLHSRTPAAVVHVSTSDKAVVLPQNLRGYQPRIPSRKYRFFQENGMVFIANLDMHPGYHARFDRRELRRLIGRHCYGRDVADICGLSGINCAYALQARARRATLVESDATAVALAEDTVHRNFAVAHLSAEEVREREKRGLLHGERDAEDRFFTVRRSPERFLQGVEDGAYDCFVLDPCPALEFPPMVSKAWLLGLNRRAMRKLRRGSKRGALLFSIAAPAAQLPPQEFAEMLRTAGEASGRRIRLVQPIHPAADCPSDIHQMHQSFSGWMVHLE